MNRGNTLVFTLLGLAFAAIVGLCFAPLEYCYCGHHQSLVDQWFPKWKPHFCTGERVHGTLHNVRIWINEYVQKHGHLSENLLEMLPPKEKRRGTIVLYSYPDPAFVIDYHRANGDWQCTVAKNPDLPGWYLLTSNGDVHFSKKGPATVEDAVLP